MHFLNHKKHFISICHCDYIVVLPVCCQSTRQRLAEKEDASV
jgi:hypothetical protein